MLGDEDANDMQHDQGRDATIGDDTQVEVRERSHQQDVREPKRPCCLRGDAIACHDGHGRNDVR